MQKMFQTFTARLWKHSQMFYREIKHLAKVSAKHLKWLQKIFGSATMQRQREVVVVVVCEGGGGGVLGGGVLIG